MHVGLLGAETLQFLWCVRNTGFSSVEGRGFLDLLAIKHIFPILPWNGISGLTHTTKRKRRGLKTPMLSSKTTSHSYCKIKCLQEGYEEPEEIDDLMTKLR